MRQVQFALTLASFAIGMITSKNLLKISSAAEIPPTPPKLSEKFVLDETTTLDPHVLEATTTLLTEHEQLTGEHIVVAIFKSLPLGTEPTEWTQELFKSWKLGSQETDDVGRDVESKGENSALLAIFASEKKTSLAVGYGLESSLDSESQDKILLETLQPQLSGGNLNAAVTLGTYFVLKALGSPLIQSGKAEEILETHKILPPTVLLNSSHDAQSSIVLALILAALSTISLFWAVIRKRTEIREWIQRFLPVRWQNQIFSDRSVPNSNSMDSDEKDSDLKS